MQLFVSLFCFSLPSLRSVAALVPGLAAHCRVPDSSAFHHNSVFPLLLLLPGLTISHIAYAIIGLSCIVIAATLVGFLSTSGKALPPRWIVIAVASGTALTGSACLLSAALSHSLHPHLAEQAPVALALLSVVIASLLPWLLSFLRSRFCELEAATLAAAKVEARFLLAEQNTTDAFMILEAVRSPNGRFEDFVFTYLNPNAEKLLGRSVSQLLGARLTRILPIQPSSRLFEQFCQVALTGKPLLHEFPLDPKDPDSPWMRHHVARLDDGIAITASDITATKREVRELLREDQHDPLTNLPNHLLLQDRVEQAIARAVRYQDKVGIFLLNLDAFEQINDRHGRRIGDEVLRVTAVRLRSAIRATDTVIRLDADEFIIILPEIKLEIDVRRTAATLAASLRKPMLLDGAAEPITVQLTSSIGAAIYPDTAQTYGGLLAAADTAMARAKAKGKNQYILYDPLIDDPANDNLVSEESDSLAASSNSNGESTASFDVSAEQCAD